MKLTKCPNGHFYDADKHPECPYCNGGLEAGSAIAQPGTAAEAGLAAAPKGPVAGWLVVLDGPARGQDLRLGEGRNFLGWMRPGTPPCWMPTARLRCGAALWCMTHRITTGVRCRDLPTSCAP